MRWIHLIAPLALAGLAGCGPGVKLVPVSGTITRDGKPMADASVTFLPDPGNKDNTPGVAATGPDGGYRLKWQDRRGVAPGKYKVTVTPPLAVPGGAKVPDDLKDDPYMAQLAIGTGAPGAKKAAEVKGEFEAEVGDGGGAFNFDVKGP
jgi:hypothetical protein